MNRIFLLNGFPGSGKDLFVSMVKVVTSVYEPATQVLNLSTIDPVRNFLEQEYGLDKTKKPEDRNLMAAISKALNDHPQSLKVWRLRRDIEKFAMSGGRYIIFVHLRETELYDKITGKLNWLNTQVETVLVLDQTKSREAFENDSDKGVLNYKYNYTIENTVKKLDSLLAQAEGFAYNAKLFYLPFGNQT